MPRAASAAVALALAAALVGAPGCGKKAPLRLPDAVRPEDAAALRASVREGTVSLRLRTPARRLFPEREEPWVLARVLRRAGEDPEFVEVGAILEPAGLPFDAELTWEDGGREAGTPLVYRVEFRDARRRRRALTPPLAVAWARVPDAPRALAASGSPGAVALSWEPAEAEAGSVRYRVLRRDAGGGAVEPLPGADVTAPRFIDSRVDPGRRYCYRVRAVVDGTGAQVEGPASGEACAGPGGVEAPAPAGGR